ERVEHDLFADGHRFAAHLEAAGIELDRLQRSARGIDKEPRLDEHGSAAAADQRLVATGPQIQHCDLSSVGDRLSGYDREEHRLAVGHRVRIEVADLALLTRRRRQRSRFAARGWDALQPCVRADHAEDDPIVRTPGYAAQWTRELAEGDR